MVVKKKLGEWWGPLPSELLKPKGTGGGEYRLGQARRGRRTTRFNGQTERAANGGGQGAKVRKTEKNNQRRRKRKTASTCDQKSASTIREGEELHPDSKKRKSRSPVAINEHMEWR